MVEPVLVPDEIGAGEPGGGREEPVAGAGALPRRALAEGECEEDERDEEEEVDRPLDAGLEDAVAGGVEMKKGGQGGIRPGPPLDRAGELPDLILSRAETLPSTAAGVPKNVVAPPGGILRVHVARDNIPRGYRFRSARDALHRQGPLLTPARTLVSPHQRVENCRFGPRYVAKM